MLTVFIGWGIPKEITPINTHVGVFRNLRMSFVITPASSIFQQKNEETLKEVVAYSDDILVTNDFLRSHMENLNEIFERFKKARLTLKTDKWKFFKPEFEYLGHMVSKNGLKKFQTKVRAHLHPKLLPSSIFLWFCTVLAKIYTKLSRDIESYLWIAN